MGAGSVKWVIEDGGYQAPAVSLRLTSNLPWDLSQREERSSVSPPSAIAAQPL